VKPQEPAVDDTAGTAAPVELGNAVEEVVELVLLLDVELEPHAAKPRQEIAPQASRVRVSFIEREVYCSCEHLAAISASLPLIYMQLSNAVS